MVLITLVNALVVVLSFIAQDRRYRFLLKIAFGILAVVLGIRYGFGNDYFSYAEIFANSRHVWDEQQEYGWYVLNRLALPVGFMGLVFILSCLEHAVLYGFICRYVAPRWYWFAVFIYVFSPFYMLVGCSMMRQFLATLLGFYAVEWALDRKIGYALLCIGFACLIHKVAVLLIPVLLLPYVKTDWKISWVWLCSAWCIAMYAIYAKMGNILTEVSALIMASGAKYADSYLNEEVLSEEHRLAAKTIVHYVLYVFLLCRNVRYLSKAGQVFSIEVLFGCLILPFAALFPMALRTTWIYTTVEIVTLPLLVGNERVPLVRYGALWAFVLVTLYEYKVFFGSEIYGECFRNFKTIFSAAQII